MIREAIDKVVQSIDLTKEEASLVMNEIMGGNATDAQIGGFLSALRMKGETAIEIAGMAEVMRSKALQVSVDDPLVDTCGTGGDGLGTFNISTTTAFVVAGAGVKVAKHGNRAASSKCGSADVLEELGVKINLSPQGVESCINTAGIGFMFAPVFHPAMKYAAGPRKELGIRTVFNFLGPLTNPARVLHQVIGVADRSICEKMAEVLDIMGAKHALIVHGRDEGLDELSLSGPTDIWEVKNGKIQTYSITPNQVGLENAEQDSLLGNSTQVNASILKEIVNGGKGPTRDVVLLNASAALLSADLVKDLKDGIKMAAESIDSGAANNKLESLINASQRAE